MDFPTLPHETPEQLVGFYFEDVKFDLPDCEALAAWLISLTQEEGKPFIELNYIFCSDERLREMNVEFLNHDYYTDVITFPYSENAAHGDVFISSERVADNAQSIGVSFDNELCRVLAHGLLHLLGYGDKTEEEQKNMRAKEDYYLAKRKNGHSELDVDRST